MKRKNLYYLTAGAVIAALYTALTIALAPVSFGNLQFRVSEALTILPVFTPVAIPGLTIGCIISNGVGLAMGANIAGPWDILFGSLATLLAAISTAMLKNIKIKGFPFLAFLPPVIFNGIIVGAELSYAYSLPLFLTVLEVAVGELGVCLILGIPLYYAIERLNRKRSFLLAGDMK